MPTAKERIEVLQDQIKKAESDEEKRKAMAEIVVLRNMVHAHRKKKSSLDKPIPTDISCSLMKATDSLAYRQAFIAAVDENTIALARKGHGGDMLDEMRKAVKNPLNPIDADPVTNSALNRNTYAGRVNEIKMEALDMLDRLEMDPGASEALQEQYRDLAVELFGICDAVKTQNENPQSNIDWSDIKYRKDAVKEGYSDEAKRLKIDPETMKQALRNMVKTKNFNFTVGSAIPKKQPAPEAVKQEEERLRRNGRYRSF